MIQTIAFDADDTLWHNETLYAMTQADYYALLRPYAEVETLKARLFEVEMRNLRVFGSVARGEARPDSDVDLLVELEDGHTLFDQVHLIDGLTDLLGRQVEAVTLCASDQPATWPALVSG